MDAAAELTALEHLVEMALAEDLGAGDITAGATVPAAATATAQIVQKAEGIVFGLEAVEEVCRQVSSIDFEPQCEEGRWRAESLPAPVALLSGSARSILAAERTALNFLGHLSGVATLTGRYVEAVRGTGARILDTRKTTPGMRLLEKSAVAAGGGTNHRIGLFDAFLIKENHIALAGGVGPAVRAALDRAGNSRVAGRAAGDEGPPAGRATVEVECETLDQLREAITAGADRALLDNMDLETLRAAVEVRDTEAGRPGPADGDDAERGVSDPGLPSGFLLEASGGVGLANVRAVAETGVELISVGALTHSAPALDFSMLVADLGER